ncbi:hypothetical protein J132_06301 [Termitomyces sp. J132]|nr:hypothetical protein H2248_011095 [Termitomyces sp. 'cryptogamus']KNZ74760.1 hypothetical protein J132_06301 [Termitomyces sp. J132]
MPSSDEPAFPPHDNVKVNGLMFKLADIEAKLIEQRTRLIGLTNEFESLRKRYPEDKIAANTKDRLTTVKLAIDATLAKAASIDNRAVVKALLE